jgi:hypothetical protein
MLLKSRRLLVFLAFALSALAFDFDDEEEPAPAARGAGAQPTFFDDESAGTTVALEHSFDGATFAPRGKLFYRDSRAGGVSRASVRVSQAKLSGDSLDEFQALLATGGHYTLRVPSVLNDPQSPPVFTSVSVCSLMASRFQERIQLSMAANGKVTALSYVLPVATAQCPTAGLPRLALDEVLFNTTISAHYPDEGAKIPAKVPEVGFLPAEAREALQRSQQATGGGEGGEGQPQQGGSFLRRYWMYILPAVIMLTMGGGEPPAQEGGGQGGGAARPAAAAAGKRK